METQATKKLEIFIGEYTSLTLDGNRITRAKIPTGHVSVNIIKSDVELLKKITEVEKTEKSYYEHTFEANVTKNQFIEFLSAIDAARKKMVTVCCLKCQGIDRCICNI